MPLFTKKTPEAKTPTLPQATPTPLPKKEISNMSKPSSYFSLRQHTFVIKGRKGKGDTSSNEVALYFEDDILAIEYVPLATVGTKTKYVREANLKELADLSEAGYDEKVTGILMKEKGYKELFNILLDNKIGVLDFVTWVKAEMDAIPPKARGRVAGMKPMKVSVDPKVTFLVSLMSEMSKNKAPEEIAEELKAMIADESLVEDAVKVLTSKLIQNKRDKDGYILLRVRTKAHAS